MPITTEFISWCGDLPQCNRRYRIGAQIREPRCPLDSAPLSDSWRQTYKSAAPQHSRDQLPVATTRYYIYETTARLRAQRSPTSKRSTTCPAIAEPARALPTGTNLRSVSYTSATTLRLPSVDQLGRLPARCPPNPACRCPSGPRNSPYTIRPALFGAISHRLQQCPYRA
jgi:hypothetical protein